MSKRSLAAPVLTLLLVFSLLGFYAPVVEGAVFFVSTDKGTYSPGEVVVVKGSATPNALVALQVEDSKGTSILIVGVRVDESGNFSRVFRLPLDALEGSYRVSASEGDTLRTANFNVLIGPLDLVLQIFPEKAMYRQETLTFKVTTNKQLKSNPTVTLRQQRASPFTIELSRAASSEWTGSYAIVGGADGPATVEVTGEDVFGNRGTASKSITVDTTPPRVTITAPSTTFDAAISLSGTVDDRSISNVELQVDTLPPSRIPVTNLAWAAQLTFITPGTHTLAVTARDEAGNVGAASTTTTLNVATGPLTMTLEAPQRVTPGTATTIWVQTSSNGKPVNPSNLSGAVIQPDGTETQLAFSFVKTGLAQAKFTSTRPGTYTVTAEASWKGIDGVTLKTFTAEPESQLPQILSTGIAQVNQGLSEVATQTATARADINSLLTLLIIATALSLVGAIAAIFAVVQIVRTIVLK